MQIVDSAAKAGMIRGWTAKSRNGHPQTPPDPAGFAHCAGSHQNLVSLAKLFGLGGPGHPGVKFTGRRQTSGSRPMNGAWPKIQTLLHMIYHFELVTNPRYGVQTCK
eukprot:1149921-Pelagomonas_calceolata.AAC.2